MHIGTYTYTHTHVYTQTVRSCHRRLDFASTSRRQLALSRSDFFSFSMGGSWRGDKHRGALATASSSQGSRRSGAEQPGFGSGAGGSRASSSWSPARKAATPGREAGAARTSTQQQRHGDVQNRQTDPKITYRPSPHNLPLPKNTINKYW